MKTLLIATSNSGKLKEFQSLFKDIFVCRALDQSAPQVLEDGKTYHANAEKKARAYFNTYQVPVLSDDSGLEIDVLGGLPGVETANFGGKSLTWPERWNLVHQTIAPFSEDKWTARFRAVLCYFDGSEPRFFEGVSEGKIVKTALGASGFGYDPIFYSFDLKKTFAEASPTEKGGVSHRARASEKFVAWAQSE